MEIVVYRVIQESLTNIVRHARASLVQISIVRVNQKIEVTIVDDGCGFDAEYILAAKDRGLGLLGMQERVELLGGHFVLNSEVGQGTRIDVELTVPDDS
jgi:signal transduction histidine kinase